MLKVPPPPPPPFDDEDEAASMSEEVLEVCWLVALFPSPLPPVFVGCECRVAVIGSKH